MKNLIDEFEYYCLEYEKACIINDHNIVFYNHSKSNQESLLNLMRLSWQPEWISIIGRKVDE